DDRHSKEMKEIESNLSRDIKEMDDRHSKEMKQIEANLAKDIREIDREIHNLDIKFLSNMKELEISFTREMKELDTKLSVSIEKVRTDLVRWIVGTAIASDGLLAALLKFVL
ncbi:MAG TPA: hypothetical protein PL048_24580, partial [Leptospiraceae bacterium]|nr:hypothetical protein [Leptospiraceae bacterium]